MDKFYLDTSIWMDFLENRKGFYGEPFGEYAGKLFFSIIAQDNRIIITDHLINELSVNYPIEEINSMMNPIEKILIKLIVLKPQHKEARIISLNYNVPKGDALHAVIARDNKSIFVSRDKHFQQLSHIIKYYKPEELI